MLRSFLAYVVVIQAVIAEDPRFTVHDLGPLDGIVTGINIRGQVIGTDKREGRVRSFRTAPNAAINWATDDLGTLGGSLTQASDINAFGQVVGTSTLSTGEVRAFRTAPNKSIQPATDNLGTYAPELETRAYGVNDSGQVIGSSGDRPFVTAPNTAINPATDDIVVTYGQFNISVRRAEKINNRGHVLGVLIGYPYYPTAFLRGDRTASVLPVISYIWQTFIGLTEQDQVVFNSGNQLFMWDNGDQVRLGTCPSACLPRSVNNSLHIVGVTEKNNPFLYARGTVYDLATLIPPGSAWTLESSTSPWSINDLGQIAGIARLNNEPHAIRLDPVVSVSHAIEQTLRMVSSLHLNLGRKSSVPAMLKLSLASKLKASLDSWNRSTPGATRGLLNEFENIVRAHAGQSLTMEQANQLIEMAEAAYALT